jgi:ABC-type antimicrobial peptide transport system permease subunit
VFLPYASQPSLTQTLAVRTTLPDPLSLAPTIRALMRQLDPTVPAYQVQTIAQVVDRSLWRQRLQGQVLGIFATLALLLATVGLYGVISYAVAQRTRELGVRMALGATRAQVVALVLRQGTRVTVAGILVGVIGALAITRAIGSLLYGVHATDPLTFVTVPITLGIVSVLACCIPARRATRVDPLVAMRAE